VSRERAAADARDHAAARPGRLDPVALALVLAGTALRLFALGRQSLWYDEIRSVGHAVGAESGTFLQTALQPRGPLYLLLLKAWIALFGTGEAQLRLLSALLGSIGLVLFHRVALRWLGRGRARIALAFLALSPFHLWYSQEATNYALLFDLGLLAVPAFLDEVERRTPRTFVTALVATAAACLANMSGFFLFVLHAGYALTADRPRRYPLKRLALFGTLSALLLSPWILGAKSTSGALHLGRPGEASGIVAAKGDGPPGLASIPFAIYTFSLGYSAGPNVDDLKRDRMAALKPHLWYLVPAGLLFALGAAWGLWKAGRPLHRVLLLWLAVPLLSMAVASALNLKPPNPRYALLAFAPYLLYLAVGADALRARGAKAAALGAVLFALAAADHQYFTNPRYWRPDARSAGHLISREWRPGDAVVVYSIDDAIRYYVPASMILLIPGGRAFDGGAGTVAWLEEHAALCRRVWIAQYHGWWYDREDRFVKACAKVMTPDGAWEFPHAPVYRFVQHGPLAPPAGAR
jgi:uncharacterized membrane protein